MSKHALSEKRRLFIYKASAGSGKTHRLTREYLSLLFSSPDAYRHILAVTFTNKATDEMKLRIIEELSKLANNKGSDYLKGLSKQYKLSEEQIVQKAKDTLVKILHDYSAFSVSTIDRFFQQTMRAFTREIGLGGNYNIELDTNKVLGFAIDSMLSDLERNENKELLTWLIRFSEEKVENGETWNIRNDIQSLSTEIFKESYKTFSTEVQSDISDKQKLDRYKDLLFTLIKDFQSKSKSIAIKALNIITSAGLSVEDFKGGSRSPFKYFVKLANGETEAPTKTFLLLDNNIDNWYTAKTSSQNKAAIESAFNKGLSTCVNEIISLYANSRFYQTAIEINRYFFTLGILGDIDKKIREYTAENNSMLIADTTELLNKIIQGSDTPFIYEKIGLRINNYMIDEFQDTSRMQWENFRPLVEDSMASGNVNYIVGDVKQSIYRWRNSDWKLLDEQLDKDFGKEGVNHETLDTNWRSAYNIIDFNNALFLQGSKLLQDTFNNTLPDNSNEQNFDDFSRKIERAYGEVYQQTPASHLDYAGHVNVNFIDTTEYPDWQTRSMEQLPMQLIKLQENGYKLKDIAILVRKKDEGSAIANYLLEYRSKHPELPYRFDIISDEALYVSKSKSIKLIISLLRFFRNPSDSTIKKLAIYEYLKYNEEATAENDFEKYFSSKHEFPEELTRKFSSILELPLYEMIEELFSTLKIINPNDQVYIQSFLDMALDYSTRYSADLDSFLNWWDESGSNKTIFTPGGQDAIRIMTIHKSKGLGFKVVLVPFCNWDIDHKLATILWCVPTQAPFNELHLVPVKYSSRLTNTIFEYEYFDEKLHAYIDNLNILYVAFTRAKEQLIVNSPKPTRDGVKDISSLLWTSICSSKSVDNNEISINIAEYLNEEIGILNLGDSKCKAEKSIRKNTIEIEISAQPSIPFDNRLKLQLKNKYFFTDTGKRDYGTLMHEIVSSIQTLDNIIPAIERFYINGDITLDQKKEITLLLTEYLSANPINEWYSGNYKVLNEIEILQPNGHIIRPDRVMLKGEEVIVVDYKFGEHEDKKYIRQVNQYINQIKKIGYEKVNGYICYITLGKTIRI